MVWLLLLLLLLLLRAQCRGANMAPQPASPTSSAT
jgi:hypothetical protein